MFPRKPVMLFIGVFFCLTLSKNASAQDDAQSQASGYDGVDILIVRDDSGSMYWSRRILATELFTLVSDLVSPPSDSPYSPVEDIRVGVVSSDMGLQWEGNPGPGEEEDGGVPTCTAFGNDGALLPSHIGTINLISDEIPCATESPNCPIDWECVAGNGGESGLCNPVPPSGDTMLCPTTSESWVDYVQGGDPVDLAAQAACFSLSGEISTVGMGCGYEQHLAAGVKALFVNPGFLRDGRLLVVLVISDESDCSIADSGFFGVPEWGDLGGGANLICEMYPEYLSPLSQIKDTLVTAKGGDENAVIFAAISGVPISPDCEGNGLDIDACLENPNMEYVQQTYSDEFGNEYTMWRAACERSIGPDDQTRAYPATRFVELAELFGERGWVFSICNEDWTGVMKTLADRVHRSMQPATSEETGLEASSSCSVAATGNNGSLLEGVLSLL